MKENEHKLFQKFQMFSISSFTGVFEENEYKETTYVTGQLSTGNNIRVEVKISIVKIDSTIIWLSPS